MRVGVKIVENALSRQLDSSIKVQVKLILSREQIVKTDLQHCGMLECHNVIVKNIEESVFNVSYLSSLSPDYFAIAALRWLWDELLTLNEKSFRWPPKNYLPIFTIKVCHPIAKLSKSLSMKSWTKSDKSVIRCSILA